MNERIAHVTRNTTEEERMRDIREKGVDEWRVSGLGKRVNIPGGGRDGGLREGFREKAEGRMRTRRVSRDRWVHGSEGPGGLEAVAET